MASAAAQRLRAAGVRDQGYALAVDYPCTAPVGSSTMSIQ